MNYAARATGLLALIAIVLLVAMLRTGLTQADHRRTERATGIREIAADSDYVRAVYEQAVGTDNDASMRAEQILSRAGKTQDALLLDRFFSYCSVKRFLNSDRDCAGLTVRAAIARAAGLAPSAKWPMDAELEARLMGALSFSLPEEEELRASTSEL